MAYLSPEAAKRLPTYKYHGGDRSKIYKYVLSPMAEKMVELCPTWLAPNVMTTVSFAFVWMTFILTVMYSPNFDGTMPGWVCVACGQFLFWYSIIDNADGKQARKTKSGSPLGLLFDHGCDAFGGVLTGLAISAAIKVGYGSIYAFLFWALTIIPFYIATWEHYVTGQLILPVINGPSEGIHGLVIVYYLLAVFGADFAHEIVPYFNRSGIDILFQGGVLLYIVTCVYQCFNVLYGAFKGKIDIDGRKYPSAGHCLLVLTPIFAIVATCGSWIALSPEFYKENTRLMLFTFGVLFARFVMHLMLSHVSYSLFKPDWKHLIPGLLVVGIVSLKAFNRR
eukprot:TRINITY_DN4103_c0_g1_i1.p1 TRINITY_DN4103_c0_g1~~TRINITY_DN4103_c0_g1_i1.p1  ORF type:complete len:337 (+),score=65.69 TRINITY_DN4103_c0_g1_i1:118-1128(+)